MDNIYDCIIIGGGSSGLFCGGAFTEKINGLILESSNKVGLKLLMSGGGSCNLTHDGSIKDFINCYFERGKAIRNILYKYNNIDMMNFFKYSGLSLHTRDDGKVFPQSMNSKDVVDFLVKKSIDNGFKIKTNHKALNFKIENNHFIVNLISGNYKCKNLVIATGGCSYPTTGSDGNFFQKLRDLDIKITPLRQGLSPIFVKSYPYSDLEGLSFPKVEITGFRDGQIIAKESGPIVFTKDCISGPAIMHISRYMSKGDSISINYIDTKDCSAWIKETNGILNSTKNSYANLLSTRTGLPKRFLKHLEKKSVTPKDMTSNLTKDTFIVECVAGYNRAMVTRGGIEIDQINLKTMEIKEIPHLFAIGEVLDVDGRTGGYNLQFAYSSAKTASSKIVDYKRKA